MSTGMTACDAGLTFIGDAIRWTSAKHVCRSNIERYLCGMFSQIIPCKEDMVCTDLHQYKL